MGLKLKLDLSSMNYIDNVTVTVQHTSTNTTKSLHTVTQKEERLDLKVKVVMADT